MIINSVFYKVKPGTRGQLLELAKPCVEETRKEKGCVEYTQYPSPENEEDMFVFEAWESMEDIMAHSKAPHILEFGEKRKPLMVEGSYRYTLYDGKVIKEG